MSHLWQAIEIAEWEIARWKALGLQLQLSLPNDEIDKISENTGQNAVERCSQKMLEAWKQQCGSATTFDKLIAALQAIDQKNYAAKLQNG